MEGITLDRNIRKNGKENNCRNVLESVLETRIARPRSHGTEVLRYRITPRLVSNPIIIYIIREEGSIFAPQRIPFCMALGVAACTVGKVRVSTVFMCVCSTFRPSDFLLFVKNGFVVGVRCQVNSESLKECEYPHCASATRRLALDNRTYSAQLANSTHTRCRPTLSWMGGRGGRVVRAEGGRGGREGGREGGAGGR